MVYIKGKTGGKRIVPDAPPVGRVSYSPPYQPPPTFKGDTVGQAPIGFHWVNGKLRPYASKKSDAVMMDPRVGTEFVDPIITTTKTPFDVSANAAKGVKVHSYTDAQYKKIMGGPLNPLPAKNVKKYKVKWF